MPKTSALLGPLLQPRRLRHAVGIDFGASHSGFAWAPATLGNPDVLVFGDWLDHAVVHTAAPPATVAATVSAAPATTPATAAAAAAAASAAAARRRTRRLSRKRPDASDNDDQGNDGLLAPPRGRARLPTVRRNHSRSRSRSPVPVLVPDFAKVPSSIRYAATDSAFFCGPSKCDREIELDEAGHLIEFTELLQRLQRRGPGISAQEIADHLGPAVEFMRFIAGEAVECINDSEGMSDPPHVVWAIAVPQTWSLADADALRAVCTDAGLIDRPDSPDLVLVPVWVAIAEALLSARLLTATTGREPFAIVDCAASETRMIVHHPRTAGSAAGAAAATAVGGMVVAPVRRDSLQVLAEAPSFALAAGARDAAEEFKSDLSSWLTPASWATVSFDYARDLRQLLLDWESLAHTFVDSAGAGERIWSVRLPPAFAPSQHGAFVLLPDAPVSVRRDASDPAAFWLDIPDVVLAAIFRRAIVPILDFVARNMAAPVRRIFFVGGFAASPEFQRLASLRFAASTECVFPSEPGHVVMRGVTLQALNTLSGDPASIQAVPIDRLLTRRSLPVQAPVLSPLSANSPTSASDPGMAMSQPDPVLPSPDEAAKDPQSAPAYHQRAHPHVLVTSATSLSLRRSSTRAGDLRTRPSNSALSWRTNSPMSARSEATTAAAVEEALAAEEAHEAALTRKRSGTLSAAGSAVERFSSTAAAAGSTVAGSRVTTEPASEPVPEREEQDAAYAQAGAAAASASQSSARWTKRPSEASTASSGLPVSDLVVGDHSDNELLDDGDALGDRSNIDGSVPISYDKDLPGVPSESHTRHDSTESGTRDRTISSAFSDHAAMSPDASMVARFGSASPMPSEADGPARVYTTLSHWVGHEPSEGRLLVSNSRASLTLELAMSTVELALQDFGAEFGHMQHEFEAASPEQRNEMLDSITKTGARVSNALQQCASVAASDPHTDKDRFNEFYHASKAHFQTIRMSIRELVLDADAAASASAKRASASASLQQAPHAQGAGKKPSESNLKSQFMRNSVVNRLRLSLSSVSLAKGGSGDGASQSPTTMSPVSAASSSFLSRTMSVSSRPFSGPLAAVLPRFMKRHSNMSNTDYMNGYTEARRRIRNKTDPYFERISALVAEMRHHIEQLHSVSLGRPPSAPLPPASGTIGLMRRARVKVQSLKPKATASSSVFSARGGSPLSQTSQSQDSDTPDPAQSAQLTAAIETQTAAIRTRIARLLRLLRATTNELAAVLERLRTRVPGVDRASHATDLWAGGMAYGHESFVVEAFHELAQIEQHAVALAREAGIDWLAQV